MYMCGLLHCGGRANGGVSVAQMYNGSIIQIPDSKTLYPGCAYMLMHISIFPIGTLPFSVTFKEYYNLI